MTTPTIARDRLRGVARNSRREWFNIRRTPGSSEATVRIYAEIGDSWWGESVGAADFARDLDQLDVETINLHINSPGGDVFDGIAIANVIRQHPARVVAIVDGLAASAASFIAAAADELEMARNSELMIHDAWGLVVGNSSDARALADRLDQMSDNIASIYAEKSGGDRPEWRDLMRAETWFSAEEAVTAGLADRVSATTKAEDTDEAKAQFDLSVFNHPGRAQAPDPVIPGRRRIAALHIPPPAPEGPPAHLQEGTSVTDSLNTAIRERLGITDADLDEGGILAALDEALAERAESPAAPPGTALVDQVTLDELRADARAGREARTRQVRDDQARLVNTAVEDGRIAPARREHWLAALKADPGAAEVLAALQPGGMLPLAAQGYTGGVEEAPDDDRVYALAWPTTPGKVG